MARTHKKFTSTVRFGAAVNALFVLGDHAVDLPPPPEPYAGKKSPSLTYLRGRDKKLAIMSKVAADLCQAYGIVGKPSGKRKRGGKPKGSHHAEPMALAA